MRIVGSERDLMLQVSRFLQVKYPDVSYRFDLAADMKLTMGQASRNKTLHPKRGYPDLFIAHPKGGKHGLYLELKREGERVYLKNGTLSTSPHIQEQAAQLQKLADLGYQASFSVGYDQTVKMIDSYLNRE